MIVVPPEESSPRSPGQNPSLVEDFVRRANRDGQLSLININITNYRCSSPSIGNNYQGSTFNSDSNLSIAHAETSTQVPSGQNLKAQPTFPAGVLVFLCYLFIGWAIRLAGTDACAQLSPATNFVGAKRAGSNALAPIKSGEQGIEQPQEEKCPLTMSSM
ncbi:hypothetical protein PM082_023971 [Marasmius tenuissimus]|nr:hypothetical protein PM082_023971 [Marasmius tenuissimus]